MPLCGYHPLMGVGIGEFAEGLVKSLADKADRKGLTVAQQFASEQDEIFVLRSFIAERLRDRLPPVEAREARAFAGLIELAGYLMGVDEPVPMNRVQFEERIRENAKRFDVIMSDFDTAFDDACEHASVVKSAEIAYDASMGTPSADDVSDRALKAVG